MKYIMKKNNVERSADTEEARQILEKLGYEVLKNYADKTIPEPIKSEKDETPEPIELEETKVKKAKKKSE